MKITLFLLLLLGLAAAVHADVSVTTDQTPQIGVKGLTIDRPATEPYATGIIWDQSETPAWATGLDITQDYPGPPDLVLAFSSELLADNLRIRADDARMALGPRIGHPVMPFQLQITAGIGNAPLGGVYVSTEQHRYGLYMEDRTPGELRNTISLQNLFLFQTDTQDSGIGDFWLYNGNTASPVFSVSNTNAYTLNAPQEGFYGAPPTAQPVVTGSWSDGSAAKNVLAALVKLGLVSDNTTP